MRIFHNATKELAFNDSSRYILSGKTIMEHVNNEEHDALFESLACISVPSGESLFVTECEHSGLGAKSYVAIKNLREHTIYRYLTI
ncbi:MAG: hypothetical protein LUC91_01425 [Prevotella sp.]|nr:hypothetical protein [Prevotella sp.]